jgi:hypothetical protein
MEICHRFVNIKRGDLPRSRGDLPVIGPGAMRMFYEC